MDSSCKETHLSSLGLLITDEQHHQYFLAKFGSKIICNVTPLTPAVTIYHFTLNSSKIDKRCFYFLKTMRCP